MDQDSFWCPATFDARARVLEKQWQQLCALYLPCAPKESIWRYHRATRREEPAEGWKLHVSATVLSAGKVLKNIAPLLINRDVQFKAPRSLAEVIRLNSGLYYNYSQIGKVFTVYSRSEEEAIFLAQRLHKLTSRFVGPSVPFDLRFTDTGNVYYRFGAFKRLEIDHENGQRALGMHAPTGELVPDLRENAKPEWMRDPLEGNRPQSRKRKTHPPTASSFRVLRALVQRGKGGVYQAIDLRTNPPRLCLLKEGRKNGELTWDGRDGAWRVRNEERVLSRLSACGVVVPRVYSSFEVDGNYYLAMEFIDGQSLQNLLMKRIRRLSLTCVLRYGDQLATFLSQMHRAGWAWRDCKPKNLIVTSRGTLMPLDFEGAAPIDRPDPLLWGTPGFTPPEWRSRFRRTGMADDLYALGAILYLLLTGRVFNETEPSIEKLRRNVPIEVRRLVRLLLSRDPDHRPIARTACAELESALLLMDRKGINRRNSTQRPAVRGIRMKNRPNRSINSGDAKAA